MLLTTERSAASAPGLAEGAAAVLHVPAGRVDEVSSRLLADLPAAVASAALAHPAVASAPDPPSEAELLTVLRAAL